MKANCKKEEPEISRQDAKNAKKTNNNNNEPPRRRENPYGSRYTSVYAVVYIWRFAYTYICFSRSRKVISYKLYGTKHEGVLTRQDHT